MIQLIGMIRIKIKLIVTVVIDTTDRHDSE